MRKAAKKSKRQGNPLVQFRLPASEIRKLRAFAKDVGYPDASAFVREMVRAAMSEDVHRVQEFWGRIMARVVERLQMRLPGMLEGSEGPRPRGGAPNA